ncbi:hypothetical protein H8356DRAFT_1687043 [Neocallimastix lanati (nom. inval.)]|jgi:hypothetical protein|nr:hypothetical protein H8356DRAFT_1687043 [Neocallimastix sp. JGI-2020a]
MNHKLSKFILIACFILYLTYANVVDYKYNTTLFKRDNSSRYYYNQLHSNEKEIYDSLEKQIESALSNGSGLYDFEIYGISIDHESDATVVGFRSTSAFVMDNPKYFWIGHGNEQKITTLGHVIKEMKISFKYSYSEEDIIRMYNEINSSVAPVVEAVNKTPTTCEKLKYIHDYLIKSIVYENGDDYNKYNIYGALVDHRSVCEGYAEAFTYICQLVDIPSIIVNSQTHEWNFVQMDDGQWYAMDVTYDDPKIGNMEFKSGNDKNKKYDYFLVGKNSQITSDNIRMPYSQSADHQLLDYLLVESSKGFEFPNISDEAYDCPIERDTNYIKDFYVPNKAIYTYILIGLVVLLVLSFIISCIKNLIRRRKRN